MKCSCPISWIFCQKNVGVARVFPRRTKTAKMCGCPNFFGLFPSWIIFCYELFLSNILNFCQNNGEVTRVFFRAVLADNCASRSHVSTSLFFSPTRLTRHFPLSNLKLFNTLRQCSNTMARSVWRKYRHKYMSMCAAKTSTCPREEQKWVHVDMWSWPSTIFCAISSLSTFTAPASPDRLQIPKLILSPLFVCKRMLYQFSLFFCQNYKNDFQVGLVSLPAE